MVLGNWLGTDSQQRFWCKNHSFPRAAGCGTQFAAFCSPLLLAGMPVEKWALRLKGVGRACGPTTPDQPACGAGMSGAGKGAVGFYCNAAVPRPVTLVREITRRDRPIARAVGAGERRRPGCTARPPLDGNPGVAQQGRRSRPTLDMDGARWCATTELKQAALGAILKPNV